MPKENVFASFKPKNLVECALTAWPGPAFPLMHRYVYAPWSALKRDAAHKVTSDRLTHTYTHKRHLR